MLFNSLDNTLLALKSEKEFLEFYSPQVGSIVIGIPQHHTRLIFKLSDAENPTVAIECMDRIGFEPMKSEDDGFTDRLL